MADKVRRGRLEYGPSGKMKPVDLGDLDSLEAQARASEDCEAYRLIAGRDGFRIGLVVSAVPDAPVTFRIEVLLQVLAENSRPRAADLERVSGILGELADRGYSLDHHDSCWVICERTLAVDDIGDECEAVMTAMRPVRDAEARYEEARG